MGFLGLIRMAVIASFAKVDSILLEENRKNQKSHLKAWLELVVLREPGKNLRNTTILRVLYNLSVMNTPFVNLITHLSD